MPPISNVLLADTDGDGELEGVAWRKVGSDADGTKRYVISIIEFDGSGITRDYDTDMGRPPPAKPPKGDWVTVESKGKRSVLKEAPGSESSLWTRPRAAGDVDGDGREEIWTVGHVDGACVYLLLRDDGVNVSLVASTPSPYPICDGADNSRHDAFLANLDGDPNKLSLGMAGGRHEPWRIFVWDLIDGTTLVPRWDSGSGVATRRDGKVATANAQNSHNVAVVDVDCDGRDEIIAGGTVVDDDGSILWGTNHWFGASAHVDGIVVDDIDPDSPGFEILLFSETGPEWGLYRAADGAPRVEAVAAEFHLQWNLAVNVSESRGLDVVGTFGGHLVDGGFSYGGGAFKPYPFGKWPREALNWFPIDWDGRGGHQACIFGFHVEGQVSSGVDRRRRLEAQPIANPRIYGTGRPRGRRFFARESRGRKRRRNFRVAAAASPRLVSTEYVRVDAPTLGSFGGARAGFLGKEIKEVNAGTKEQILRVLVSAVDIVGDHREEVLVQMADGSLRAYFNVATPFVQKPTKLEDPHYRRFLGHATFPSHVAALGTTCSNTEPLSKKAPPPRRDWEGSTRDVAALKERRRPLELHANSRENSADSRDRGRAALKSLDQEITVAELRVAVRRMINACESPGCWRRADRDTNRHGETQADKARRKDPNAVDPTHGPDPTIAERRQPVRDSRCDRARAASTSLAAASPRLVSLRNIPGRLRGISASSSPRLVFAEHPRPRRRDSSPRNVRVPVAATRLRGISASPSPRLVFAESPRPRPRRRRDSSPRNLHVLAAATRLRGISTSPAAASPRLVFPSRRVRVASARRPRRTGPRGHGLGAGQGAAREHRRPVLPEPQVAHRQAALLPRPVQRGQPREATQRRARPEPLDPAFEGSERPAPGDQRVLLFVAGAGRRAREGAAE